MGDPVPVGFPGDNLQPLASARESPWSCLTIQEEDLAQQDTTREEIWSTLAELEGSRTDQETSPTGLPEESEKSEKPEELGTSWEDLNSTPTQDREPGDGTGAGAGARDGVTLEGGRGEEGRASSSKGGSPFRRGLMDGTLPDLLRSGNTLSRRRTVGPVSDTLKEVRREVELSRRRSLRLKAQVDKLQSQDGPGWSQHKERVKEEILSILGLLRPLTEGEMSPEEPRHQDDGLDSALMQLQSVARKLALKHTSQDSKQSADLPDDGSVLEQALRDRDDAIAKKFAMEGELLRSKTELMSLNNDLLEAVQSRLEISLELEAWKDDVQVILRQQLQSQQQQSELQAQRKPSRLGLLRRSNKPMLRRLTPPTLPPHSPSPPSPSHPTISTPPSSPSTSAQRTSVPWKEKLWRGKTSRQADSPDPQKQTPPAGGGREVGFHTVSLD